MKCFECGFKNHEGSKFCSGCGRNLAILCPSCNSRIESDGKFCFKCGCRLPLANGPALSSLNKKMDRLQKYLPKGITERILSGKSELEGERKEVTVMFCDLVGFTEMAGDLDPEETYSIVEQIMEMLIHKVHEYGGTVNQLLGDGLYALFGAPVALESGPQKAIYSAIAMHKALTCFSGKITQKINIPPLEMRIGINTGIVVVGNIGSSLRVDFTAVGDTINLASRMEGIAEPGTIYVTRETFERAEHYFRFEALGEKKIKGKDKPVVVYQVIAPSTRNTRFEVSTQLGLTTLVGRQRELAQLVEGFQMVREGRGQAFSLMAEAGIGKSRLLHEFNMAIAREEVNLLEGKCLSYAKNIAYFPIMGIIRSDFNIRKNDEESVIREKIRAGLLRLQLDDPATYSFFLGLFSIRHPDADEVPLSRDEKRFRFMAVFKQIILKSSEIRPTVLAIEDLHWIDGSSEELLKEMIEAIPGASVLLLFTYRPEATVTWRNKSYHSQIILNRLSDQDTLIMAKYLLAVENVDKGVKELILNKTEGIPFYLEELVKSFKGLDIIVKKENHCRLTNEAIVMEVPSTIQDVIMSRVDSLPAEAKSVLQVGSVIENEFKYNLLKQATCLSDNELLLNLSILKEAEFIYEHGFFPEATFFFKHALTREVVYNSLLNKRKKSLHNEIGCVIEEMSRRNMRGRNAILAEHFIKAEKFEKGAEYSRKAARRAEYNASFADAIAHTKNRVAALEKLSPSEEIQHKIVAARTNLGLRFHNLSYLKEAREAIDPIYDFVLANNIRAKLPLMYTIMGAYYYMVDEDLAKALDLLNKALGISKETGDTLSELYANLLYGLTLTWDCQFEKAEGYLNKALHVVKAFKNTWGMVVIKCDLSFYVYNYQGDVKKGFKNSKEALEIARSSNDIFSEAYAYTCHGISYYYRGLFKKSKKFLLSGAELCDKIKLVTFGAIAHQYLGFAYYYLEQYQKSRDSFSMANQLRKASGTFPSSLQYCKIALKRSEAALEDNYELLELPHEIAQKNIMKLYKGAVLNLIGGIILHSNGPKDFKPESWINRAIASDVQNGMMWHVAQDYSLYGDFYSLNHNRSDAGKCFSRAIDIFEECHADGWCERIRHKRSAL